MRASPNPARRPAQRRKLRSVMTTDLHQATRAALATGVPDPDTRSHLDRCSACRQWNANLANLLAAAPSAFFDVSFSDVELTDRIVSAVHAGEPWHSRRRFV